MLSFQLIGLLMFSKTLNICITLAGKWMHN